MELGCIDSSRVMFMPESGLMGSVMGVEYILVRMGAAMLGSSSGVLNMDLVIITSGKLVSDLCFRYVLRTSLVIVYDEILTFGVDTITGERVVLWYTF